MPIQGLRTTGNFASNQRPESWREVILRVYPNGMAPLTALTNLMKSEAVDDPVFHWWQKAFPNRRLKFSTNMGTGTTAITIDDTYTSALSVKAGDMLLVEGTGEIVRIASDPTVSTGITITRAQGGTTATAIDPATAGVNYYMLVIGSAYEEGSLAPTGVNYDPVDTFNYTQIFRNTLEMTRTAEKTRLRTGDQMKEAKRECLEIHSVDIEKALWFGKRSTGTLNGKPYRTTDGIVAQIVNGAPQNVLAVADADGLIDMDWLEATFDPVFSYGSSEKMVFTSNVGLMALQQAVRKNSTWNIQSGIKEYGMNVTRVTSPFGDLVFKTHPLFNQMRGGTNGGTVFNAIANNWYILDMGEFWYRYFRGDDFRYQKPEELTAVGLDGSKAGYLTECGVELHHPEAHYIITGVRGGKADAA